VRRKKVALPPFFVIPAQAGIQDGARSSRNYMDSGLRRNDGGRGNLQKFAKKINLLAGVCVMMVAVHLLNFLSGYQLLFLGVLPREPASLIFIPLMPFLHGSVAHMTNNLVGLLIFGGLLAVRSKKLFVQSSIFIVLVSGILVWFFGRPSIHVGASGWVFGLWSLIIAMAFFRRQFIDLLIALFVIVF
jgi:membrane associated rhomboid family serine protease